jgi:hypothetical protein
MARLNRDIASKCRKMVEFEEANHVGISTVVGDVPEPVRIATCLLTASAITDSVRLHDVGEVVGLAACDDPTEALLVREAFTGSGVLRPHVDVESRRASNISELRNPALRESSLRRLLGLEPDAEFDAIEAVRRSAGGAA